MREEPREYWFFMPRRYRPGELVTPRRWTGVTVRVQDGGVDPRVVGAEARCPDNRLDVELGSVLEADRALTGAGGAPAQINAVAALELSQAGADQQVAPLGAAAPAVQLRRDQA